MKRIHSLLVLVLLPACAHLGLSSDQRDRSRTWSAAHDAFAEGNYSRATALFQELSARYPDTLEGRESLFYVGTVHLDPRNPGWDSRPAETALTDYLRFDSISPGSIHRRPEGETLLQLARQLNMPARERVPGLQPEVVTREVEVPRVVVSAQESRALAAEAERLRTQVAERDATIRQLREELERIRRTLTRPTQ
jgi:hypothetical protein